MSLSEKIAACSVSFSDKRKTIVDKKAKSNSSYKIENPIEKEFKIIRFDDCVFDSSDSKCDFGMQVANESTIHFVELKGSDNNQGLKQLHQTLTDTKDYFFSHTRKVRLIVSRAEAPRNLDRNIIDKIATLTGDIMNGKKQHFIKANHSYTEIIN